MKATELMLGNWVQNHYPETYQIENGWQLDEGEELFGIPLTEEWLLKFGNAEKGIFPDETIVCDRFVFLWKECYKYWYVLTLGSCEYLTKIEFVHEYQNFIFALTSEELTIK